MAKGLLGILLILFSIIESYILTYPSYIQMSQLNGQLKDLKRAYKVKSDYFMDINEDYGKINESQSSINNVEVAIPDRFAPVYDFSIIYDLASSNGLSIENISFEEPEPFSFEEKEESKNNRRRVQRQPTENNEIISVYGLRIEKPQLLRSKMSITVSGDYIYDLVTENNDSENTSNGNKGSDTQENKILGVKNFIKELEENARIFDFENIKIERVEVSFMENGEQVQKEKFKAMLDFYVYTYEPI